MKHRSLLPALATSLLLMGFACTGNDGAPGPVGPPGEAGPPGPAAEAGAADYQGTISGTVNDAAGAPLPGVSITTWPPSTTATSDAHGAFSLVVSVGEYNITASKASYAPYTLAAVPVAAKATTNVSLVLSFASTAPATITGTVTNSKESSPDPIAGAVVSVDGQGAKATTDATGAFTLTGVAPGPVFLSVTPPDPSTYLPGDLRNAIMVNPGATVTGVHMIVSARPSDAATYIGLNAICQACHGSLNQNTGDKVGAVQSAAHNRSLARIARDANGAAAGGAWARLLNPALQSPRTVMIPLAGSIAVPAGAIVTGTGTAWKSTAASNCGSGANLPCALQAGDVLGYTPKGLGWTVLGTIQSVDSDAQVTLAAAATFAPTVTSLPAGTPYSVERLSRTGYMHQWPEDANDIVAPFGSFPTNTGVKATNPNYDPNDPKVYDGTYGDGQVNVYLCNLKGRTLSTNGASKVTFPNDEYVAKFGGQPFTCSDGSFWDGTNTPTVPLVRIDVIYGGCGDVDGGMAPKENVGVFKQRYQGHLADVKVVSAWDPPYASVADRDRDSVTLPVQLLQSGSQVNGGYLMNGYHPTENAFPGESWTQRSRTFSHACAGCHATGMTIDLATASYKLPIPRDGTITTLNETVVTAYNFKDENITCEHCHGPASEHLAKGGGRATGIINPMYLTAEASRQLCGKCHGYDDAVSAKPDQTYGFEYPWNDDWKTKGLVGGGNFVPGVFELKDAFANFGERGTDDEAFWDPARTGGNLYGQAHRQQYTMLGHAVHTNNPYVKLTCVSCHDAHTTYLGSNDMDSIGVQSGTADVYQFPSSDYRDNSQCLSCHAGGGPLSFMKIDDEFAGLSKDDVAALFISSGGTVTKNDKQLPAPSGADTAASLGRIALAVAQHMQKRAGMSNAPYNPTGAGGTDTIGRCTGCHMPKLAKSGGYEQDVDDMGNLTIVQGDQASHVFDIVWPATAVALSRGGPTFRSGSYGQFVSATNVKYDLFGYMPNSCSECHIGARRPSMLCPDTKDSWPSYWPFNDPTADPNMQYVLNNCFTSTMAP
jgi:hypothetical protein